MSIERLRALEKAVELVAKATPGPWQAKNEYEWDEIIGNVDGPDAGQFHYSHVCSVDMNDERKPEHFANAELIIAAVNFIREHGSALIAELGQEVGAVSFAEWFRDACSATDFDANNGDAAAATNRSYARQAWCAAMTSSPAHTLEARDAARYRWIREKTTHEDWDGYSLPHVCDIDFKPGSQLNEMHETLDAAIDAAMRQEGGK